LPSTAITRYPPARQEAQPRLWRGQEGQRPQAARRRRHDRATAVRADHRRRRPGPRRGETAAVEPGTWNLRKAFPSVRLTWADGGYAGKFVTWAKSKLKPLRRLRPH